MAIVFNSYDWSKSFNTIKHPLKMEFKYISFRKMPFCRFMHSMRENKDLKHQQRNMMTFQNQTGRRVLFSVGNMKFKQCSFPDRQRLFLCEKLCLVTVLLWHSKTSVIASYKLWGWFNRWWQIYCSLRPGSFDFAGLLFITQLLFLFWS